ncbi:MAG: hypothetical protein HQK50_16450 [Oligoflexia bacterium]|nr:hypothetical protein [Oligoflexia bacterium]MBF0367168.1 hypothetical protein [Oligoflexia bacterium]
MFYSRYFFICLVSLFMFDFNLIAGEWKKQSQCLVLYNTPALNNDPLSKHVSINLNEKLSGFIEVPLLDEYKVIIKVSLFKGVSSENPPHLVGSSLLLKGENNVFAYSLGDSNLSTIPDDIDSFQRITRLREYFLNLSFQLNSTEVYTESFVNGFNYDVIKAASMGKISNAEKKIWQILINCSVERER